MAAELQLIPAMVLRHGGPKRLDRARKANGRLRWAPAIDRGHERAQIRRQAIGGDATDPRSGYPLGALMRRGLLSDLNATGEAADRQNAERHDAGLRLASEYVIAFGIPTAGSHLANLSSRGLGGSASPLASERQARAERRYAAAVKLIAARLGKDAVDVLFRIAIEESWWLGPSEHTLLRSALALLVED